MEQTHTHVHLSAQGKSYTKFMSSVILEKVHYFYIKATHSGSEPIKSGHFFYVSFICTLNEAKYFYNARENLNLRAYKYEKSLTNALIGHPT